MFFPVAFDFQLQYFRGQLDQGVSLSQPPYPGQFLLHFLGEFSGPGVAVHCRKFIGLFTDYLGNSIYFRVYSRGDVPSQCLDLAGELVSIHLCCLLE